MYNYVVLGRKGSIVRFVFKSDPPAKPRALDLAGFDYKGIRKGVQLDFNGDVKPENLLYSGDVKPRKLVAIGGKKPAKAAKESKKAPKAEPTFIVVKRVKQVIEYKICGDESAEPLNETLKISLAGYDYRKLRKDMTFQFEGGKIAAENIRYWPFRGTSNKLPLPKLEEVAPKAKSAAVSKRGATPNVSILRKHF
ncbi:hypothetical protein FDI85_gp160 [Erwinia phage Machina]|uniref:Uncharacterized protein n=2 Tax=Machinavirus machina TaxID=2169990 RepID=A0A1B2ID56_9CAUD|nr:hypothetical protein BIZ81_gp159 [Erwinia phage vB_EamM_Huxley]YP_009617041.1 hypothetical protein FDI85_gp160 [Erwinia phage Machina]ANZ49206.1 hypothetical protein HUXLEY_124 [Erwinia phage vB_EamM_Huxley]ANZ49762.1 hypothetical protein MACHINA_124 [Erwinia phage Machina]ANZ50034.1 hypothetical protein PARSHIK_125 [Erwinia phage vB_EamM_Parshik]